MRFWSERWIIAALRHRKFFSLAELNEAIAELLEKLNHRPFRKREGTRASLFAELDRPALQPLAGRTLCHGPLEDSSRQHRLPRRGRSSLLQRSLPTGGPKAGSPLHRHDGGNLSRRETCGLSCAEFRRLPPHHDCRAHAQEPSGPPGVDAITSDSLGRDGGNGNRSSGSHDPGKQAASGDGLSRLPRDSAWQRPTPTSGWKRPASAPSNSGLLLSKLEIDSETMARSTDPPSPWNRNAPALEHENLRGPHYYDPPTTLLQ